MNMISTGAFLNEMDASNKQPTVAEKFAAVWEKKNAKAARAGGVSLMALSLAACGGSSSTTTTTDTTTTTPAAAGTTTGLTSNTDIVTLGSGDDTVMASGTSLGSDDVITDTGGTDILKASVVGAGGAAIVVNTTGVEDVRVTNTGAGGQEYIMTSASGVTSVTSYLSASGGAVTFTDLQANAKVILDGSAGVVTAEFANAVVVGDADEATIEIKNDASASVVNIGDTADEFETINIVVGSGKNTITEIEDGASDDLTETSKIVISGSGQLTLGETALEDAAEIDGSAATGKLLITTDATVDKVTGGSAADTFTITVGDLGSSNAAKTIDGGAGEDTIKVAANLGVSDFDAKSGAKHVIKAEVLNADITDAAVTGSNDTTDSARTVDVALIDGLTKVTSAITNEGDSGDTSDAILNVKGIAAGLTVDVSGTAGTHASAGARLTIELEDASAAADALTVDADGRLEILDLNATSDDATTTATETGGIETLTISSSDVNATTGKAKTLTIDELEAFEVTTVNITGSNKITISAIDVVSSTDNANKTTAADRATETVTFDASEATALFSLTTTETGYVTVKGGAGGIDVDLGATGTSKDVIEGGSATTDKVTIIDGTSTLTHDMTVSGVETIEIDTITSGDHTTSLKNVTGATKVVIMDSASDAPGFGTKVTNVGSEEIYIKTGLSTDANDIDFSNAVMSIDTATSTTEGTNTTFVIGGSVNATTGVNEATGLDGTVFTTDTDTLTIRDEAVNYDSSGSKTDEYLDHAVDIAGLSSTEKVTKLVISGGGDTDGSTAAVEESTLTLVDNSNVALTSIDATGWMGNLNLAAVGDLQAGSTVTMGGADSTVTAGIADLLIGRTTFDLGAGDDTLATAASIGAGAAKTYYLNAANTENFTIILEDDAVTSYDTTVDFSGSTAMKVINLSTDEVGSGAAEVFDGALTLMNVADGATVEFDTVATTQTTYGGSSDAHTINGASGATSINLNNKGATGAVVIGNSAGLTLGAAYTTATVSNVVASDALTFTAFAGAGLTSLSLSAAEKASNGALTMTAITAGNLETLTIDSGIGAVTVSDLGTMNKLETFSVDTGDATASAKTTITAGTSTSVDTITATGSGAFEITALTAASLDSIEASGVSGGVTLGTSSAALTAASGASYTTGTGDDTVTLNMSNLVALNAGEKASDSDTLILVGAQNSGTTVIDLSSTTDQLSSANGFANAGVQLGIENVDVSAVTSTGSYGFQITATAEGSTITGGAYNDSIILGTADKADVVKLVSATGADTITNFKSGTDKYHIDIKEGTATAGDIDAAGAFTLVGTSLSGSSNIGGTTSNVDVITSALTGSAYDGTYSADIMIDLTAVITTDGTQSDLATKIINGDAGGAVLGTNNAFQGFILTDTTGGDTQLWYKGADVSTTSQKLDAAELTLITTFSGVTDVAATDFVFI